MNNIDEIFKASQSAGKANLYIHSFFKTNKGIPVDIDELLQQQIAQLVSVERKLHTAYVKLRKLEERRQI